MKENLLLLKDLLRHADVLDDTSDSYAEYN